MTTEQKLIRPTILFEGKEILVDSIHWNDGGIGFVGFMKESGKYETAFQKFNWEQDGYNDRGILRLDLEKCVKWGSAAELTELEAVE